ncbi:pyruvate kinase [Striga asiatica]|uniref:pyruvate kinase n=1 Tax=Striga asiatica TaxID=4170 RepID=A0A5A7PDY9_STRAF|nr:pyruvate kinase [Striga asiatica]
MIWKLAEAGINTARLNMSQGDHASHQMINDLVEYNAQAKDNVIAIMLDTKGPEVDWKSMDLCYLEEKNYYNLQSMLFHHPTELRAHEIPKNFRIKRVKS